MIYIKHFIVDRDGKPTAPSWKAAEDWLQELFVQVLKEQAETMTNVLPEILHVKAYPSAVHHNLILIVDDHRPGAQ